MKKFIVCLVIAFSAIGMSAQSQGEMAIGVDLGVAPCFIKGGNITNFGLGAKFRYNVTDPIRLEADLEYWLKNKQFSVFDVSANIQYVVGVADKWTVYPTAGIGIGHVALSGLSWDKFLFNVGIGTDYELTRNLSIGAEMKYQYMQDFSRLPIQVGLTYRF